MIKIRNMIPSDFQHVGPLYKEMVLEQPKPYPAVKDINAEIEDIYFYGMQALKTLPNFFAAVALDGGVSKGFIMGALASRIIGNPRIYFLGEVLFVTKNFRHRGIGQQLVNNAAEWAVSRGAGAFEVAFTPGTEAHKHWAKMGFRSYLGTAVLATRKMEPLLGYPILKVPGETNRSDELDIENKPIANGEDKNSSLVKGEINGPTQ